MKTEVLRGVRRRRMRLGAGVCINVTTTALQILLLKLLLLYIPLLCSIYDCVQIEEGKRSL